MLRRSVDRANLKNEGANNFLHIFNQWKKWNFGGCTLGMDKRVIQIFKITGTKMVSKFNIIINTSENLVKIHGMVDFW